MSSNAELAEKYLSVLQKHDLSAIYGKPNAYSGIFLPSVSESYSGSSIRTMIVGKEPMGWHDHLCAGKTRRDFDLEEVRASVGRHSVSVKVQRPRSKFIQFYRKACKTLNNDDAKLGESIIWSNLMCVSLNKKSPVRKDKTFPLVKNLSRDLLYAQIEVLDPQVILFVTGTSYDKYIREFFPKREASVPLCPGKLWSFKIGDTQCFRTSHPQWSAGIQYRDRALSLAKAESCAAQSS